MLCQNCNERNATVHLTRIINGEKTEVYLCEQCAREKGEFNFVTDPFSFHNLLAGIFSSPEVQPGRSIVKQSVGGCKNCDMSFSEFGKSGQFGCSECYSEFEPQVSHLLRRIQGSDQHTGKVPSRMGKSLLLKKRISELRSKLQEVVANEEYEKAAELRDQIYELEKNGKVNGGED